MRSLPHPAALVASVVVAVVVSACAPAGPLSDRRGGTADVAGEVSVLAAASLTESFERIAAAFEAEYPEVRVTLSFGGSSALAQQVLSGAPADVFAAASSDAMAAVTASGATAGEPVLFARNRLAIAVPWGNPGDVAGLGDLADPARTIALCSPQVPCGALAQDVLAAAGVVAAPDTLERDVRAAMAKVRLGEVDAALVYRTDVQAAAGAVEGISFPESDLAANDYLVAVLAEAQGPGAARAFLEFVLSPSGRGVLADAGFELP